MSVVAIDEDRYARMRAIAIDPEERPEWAQGGYMIETAAIGQDGEETALVVGGAFLRGDDSYERQVITNGADSATARSWVDELVELLLASG